MTRTNIFSDIVTRQRTARLHTFAVSVLLAAVTVFSIASLTTAG